MDENLKGIEKGVKGEATKLYEDIAHNIIYIESNVEAWLLRHPVLFYSGLALLGATVWETIEHVFGLK